jgi:hypothetical protein
MAGVSEVQCKAQIHTMSGCYIKLPTLPIYRLPRVGMLFPNRTGCRAWLLFYWRGAGAPRSSQMESYLWEERQENADLVLPSRASLSCFPLVLPSQVPISQFPLILLFLHLFCPNTDAAQDLQDLFTKAVDLDLRAC